MRLPSNVCLLLLSAAVLLTIADPVEAGAEGKGGFFDTSYDRSQKVGTRFVQWLWWPYYEVGSVPYVVYAFCERDDESGQPVGNNKVKFSNIVLRGVDTNTEVSFRKKSVRLRDGRQSEILTWDAGDLRSIAHETAVIGGANVKVSSKIAADDFFHCEVGTAEITGTSGAGSPP